MKNLYNKLQQKKTWNEERNSHTHARNDEYLNYVNMIFHAFFTSLLVFLDFFYNTQAEKMQQQK